MLVLRSMMTILPVPHIVKLMPLVTSPVPPPGVAEMRRGDIEKIEGVRVSIVKRVLAGDGEWIC